MNSNERNDHSKFDDIFGGNTDREALDQPIGVDKVTADDLPQHEDQDEYETVTVHEYDTELGHITEQRRVKVEKHTVTMSENEEHAIGSLTIRIVAGQTIHDERSIYIYGRRNDDELAERDDLLDGDCEVELDSALMSDDDFAAFENDTSHALTFTLTQRQVDDALALYDSIYGEEYA